MTGRSFLFWGASGHARVLADLIALQGDRLLFLFDNNRTVVSPWPEVKLRYGMEGFAAWLASAGNDLPLAAVAIGGSLGRDRCHVAGQLASAGLVLPPLLHPASVVAQSATIADGSQVLAGAIVGSSAYVGNCTIVNTGAQIDHECRLDEGVHIAPGATLCGCVVVGAFSLIGPAAVVLPRVRIGRNVIIGAGAVVTRDIPDNVVAWGSPARVIEENNE